MHPIEVKFLFEGIIFSTQVFVHNISRSLNRYEFSINFFSKYLISKYSKGYDFVLENNKFTSIDTVNTEEAELIKTIQEAISKIPQVINKTLVS
jgi:hypothetical protein